MRMMIPFDCSRVFLLLLVFFLFGSRTVRRFAHRCDTDEFREEQTSVFLGKRKRTTHASSFFFFFSLLLLLTRTTAEGGGCNFSRPDRHDNTTIVDTHLLGTERGGADREPSELCAPRKLIFFFSHSPLANSFFFPFCQTS